MYIPNFNFLAQFGGVIGNEMSFFKVKKEKNSHICAPNRSKKLIFGYVIQLSIVY